MLEDLQVVIDALRTVIDELEPSRERSLALTKLDECEMWLAKCREKTEASSS